MLKVAYSNKPETLLAQFAADLQVEVGLPPRDPFTEVQFVVASRPLEAWVKAQLAPLAGVVTNFRTWLLHRFAAHLVERAFPGQRALDGAAMRDRLLARFLDQSVDEAGLEAVRHYLGAGAGLELRHLQLSAQVGALFEEYLFTRGDMLKDWTAGKPSPLDGGGELAAWQRGLWRPLANDSGLVLPTAVLSVDPATLVEPGRPLYVFGLSSVGTFFHDLFRHLGRATIVHVYALNPCREFWEDLESVRDRRQGLARRSDRLPEARKDVDDPFELRGDACRPLALWGRPGRESVRLLNLAADGKAEGLFIDPARHAPTLLRQLQADILTREELAPGHGTRLPVDDTVQALAAPSVRRECEAVAGRIWALLEQDRDRPPLRLDDVTVLIAARDAEAYVAPLLGAFREHHNLPWQLVGLPFALTSPIVEAAQALLELPLTRFTRADVARVLTHPCVMEGVPGASAETWLGWIDALGIVQGLDHAEHAQTAIDRDVLNWDQGLRRLALGAFLTSRADGVEQAFAVGTERYFPDPAGQHLEEGAGGLLRLARSLLADARALRDARLPVATWADAFERLFTVYLSARGEQEQRALEACLKVVRGLRQRALGDRPVSFRVARELVQGELSAAGSSSGGAVTGGVRLSSLAAARGVPSRVTFIVGLGEGTFPGSDRAEALDLRRAKPRPGDANAREKDEYLFLEALLAAQDKLVLSWVARDEGSGEARAPSPVVVELLALLDTAYLGRDPKASGPHPLIVTLPLWRADADPAQDVTVSPSRAALEERALREAGGLLGRAAHDLDLRQFVRGLPPEQRTALATAFRLPEAPTEARATTDRVLRVGFTALRRFLECPLQGAARVRLGLRDDGDEDLAERTDEVFSAAALTTTPLLRRTFLAAWQKAGGGALPASGDAWEDAWRTRTEPLVASGQFPVGPFLEGEWRRAAPVLDAWRGVVGSAQPGPHRTLSRERFGPAEEHEDVDVIRDALRLELTDPANPARTATVELVGPCGPRLGDSHRVVLVNAKKSSSQTDAFVRALPAWIDHLVLTASGHAPPTPCRVLLAFKEQPLELELAALPQAEAKAWLERVVGDLLFGHHDVLFPVAPVVRKFIDGLETPLEELVRDAFADTFGAPPCQGPVRRLDSYPVPHEAEAQRLYDARLRLLVEHTVWPEKPEKKSKSKESP